MASQCIHFSDTRLAAISKAHSLNEHSAHHTGGNNDIVYDAVATFLVVMSNLRSMLNDFSTSTAGDFYRHAHIRTSRAADPFAQTAMLVQ